MFSRQGFFCFLIWVLLCSGCAPVLSQGVINESEKDFPFEVLKQEPERYIGKTLLLGGTIVKVTNQNSGSLLEVVQRPLGYRMEPKITDETQGRFLVFSDQLWDDQVFSRGRKITLAGKVTGKETRPLDQTTYTYPLLAVREYHLWPVGSRSYSSPQLHIGIGVFGSF